MAGPAIARVIMEIEAGMRTRKNAAVLKHHDPIPALYIQFADAFFTIAKTQNPFSMIGFDQKPEQQNKELKIRGATLNLSDECVFTEWAVAGPAIARVITEFEAGMRTLKNAVLKHHDPIPSVQQRFFAHTTGHSIAGNPFDEDSHKVVIIDTR